MKLHNKNGPFVIIGRPHSGTRLLAAILNQSKIFMGNVSHGYLDSIPWCFDFVKPIVCSKNFPDINANDLLVQRCLKKTMNKFFKSYNNQPYWGWKYSETLFLMPILVHHFPKIKFIHIIRDGRDVVLSDDGYFQITAKPSYSKISRYLWHRKSWNFTLRVVFGTDQITKREKDFLGPNIYESRFQLQMQFWSHCVQVAREYGAQYPSNYKEIKYEDLCRNPTKVMEDIYHYLGIDLDDQTANYAIANSSTKRVGKWQNYPFSEAEYNDFQKAVQVGSELLSALDYQ